MYLIVGRTGSGKTYLANLLSKYGFNRVVSWTTRPKRPNEPEDAYHFCNKLPDEKLVAYTKINGYEYGVTKDDLKGKDFYVIDPNGIIRLKDNFPVNQIKIIYITAIERDRKLRVIKRSGLDYLLKRDQSENEQFSVFEKALDDRWLMHKYCASYQVLTNNYDDKLEMYARILAKEEKGENLYF